MSSVKLSIVVRGSFVAFHRWPGASEQYAYLGALHRHTFHFRCVKSVTHSDRDVEFNFLKTQMQQAIDIQRHTDDTSTWSCERWAEWLLEKFQCILVEVNEDGENGGIAECI